MPHPELTHHSSQQTVITFIVIASLILFQFYHSSIHPQTLQFSLLFFKLLYFKNKTKQKKTLQVILLSSFFFFFFSFYLKFYLLRDQDHLACAISQSVECVTVVSEFGSASIILLRWQLELYSFKKYKKPDFCYFFYVSIY